MSWFLFHELWLASALFIRDVADNCALNFHFVRIGEAFEDVMHPVGPLTLDSDGVGVVLKGIGCVIQWRTTCDCLVRRSN